MPMVTKRLAEVLALHALENEKLQQDAESADDDERGDEAQDPVTSVDRDFIADVAAEHVKGAVRQIDVAHEPEDEREPARHEENTDAPSVMPLKNAFRNTFFDFRPNSTMPGGHAATMVHRRGGRRRRRSTSDQIADGASPKPWSVATVRSNALMVGAAIPLRFEPVLDRPWVVAFPAYSGPVATPAERVTPNLGRDSTRQRTAKSARPHRNVALY